MERKITNDLLKWKKEVLRKPLLIYGNKQIGKTYSVIDFGEKEYKSVTYIDTFNNKEVEEIMINERTIDNIILKLSLINQETIFKNDTLIILDNVESINVIKAIKKFGKGLSDYHIIMITSKKEDLSIFKCEEFQYKYMFSMDFEEFLKAVNNIELIDYIKSSFKNNKPMPFHNLAMELYDDYILTGGLPEVVLAYINKETLLKRKIIQQKILDTYKTSFLYINNTIDILRAEEVLNSLPYQFLKSNHKFQYTLMKNGSRSRDYENAINFMNINGYAYKCHKVGEVVAPLSKNKDNDSFKLYLNDTGILSMMMHVNKMRLLTDNNIRMVLYENMVANSIISSGYNLYYYQSDGKAEVPFIVQLRSGVIIPIELVNKNISKSKSLSLLMNKFNIEEAIRITDDNFSKNKKIKYIPIYALFCLREVL